MAPISTLTVRLHPAGTEPGERSRTSSTAKPAMTTLWLRLTKTARA